MENNYFIFCFVPLIFSLEYKTGGSKKTGGLMTNYVVVDSQESSEYIFFSNQEGFSDDSTPFGQKT